MTRVGLTQRVTTVEEYGERRDCLDQEWIALLQGLGYTPIPLPNNIESVAEYLETLELDAIILTSGNDLSFLENPANPASERDRFESSIIEYATKNRLPILGVCRGLEVINTHFGGNLTKVSGHVDEIHSVQFEIADSREGLDYPEQAHVNSYHDFGIDSDDVADPVVVLGTAKDMTAECVVHEEFPIWGIMWHPERKSPSEDLDRKIIKHVIGNNK